MSSDRREEFYELRHLWRPKVGAKSHALTATFAESNADSASSGGIFLYSFCGRHYIGRADAPTKGHVFQAPRHEADCRECALRLLRKRVADEGED